MGFGRCRNDLWPELKAARWLRSNGPGATLECSAMLCSDDVDDDDDGSSGSDIDDAP